uniref:Putative gustatory receptor 77a n=2 Tax=Drosophila melanogaster TaxID=7227 RepID=GR77A_DROME|nr:gustatory receptor 77a [Drosophila melanogaster]Q8IPU5.1 RecName: Full=Putative gustatory receptor 77a [Drosophila melanogaster]AAN12140.1 gustatory receptor 77a [Drosophila melanogaster]|eukprot:NP_730560.1 gustatory receptor 77a [Drosophila melanogaster]
MPLPLGDPLALAVSPQLGYIRITAMPRWLQLPGMSALGILYSLTRVFGLMATANWSPRGIKRVRQSLYLRIHGCVMLIFVGCFSPFAFWCIFQRMAFLRQNRILLMIGFNRYVLLLVCAFMTLWIHCFKQAEIIGCLNRLLKCRRRLRRLMHTRKLKDSMDCLATKGHLLEVVVLLSSYLLSMAQPIQILKDDPEVRRNFMYACSLVFVSVCQAILQLSLGMYTMAILFLGHLVRHSNLLLAKILADAEHIFESSQKAGFWPNRQELYKGQQKWLALELWRLLHVHHQLLKLHRSICSLCAVQAVCFLGFVPLECTIHLFFTYFMKYSKFILRKYGRSFPLNYFAIAFLVGLFTNLLLVILPTYYSERRFNCTREIIKGGGLAFPSRITVKQLRHTMHFYGLYLKNVEHVFAVSACGLFKLNNAILFCIVGAILEYLMILIQFDKVLNK